jgi:hypothetical protein
MPPRIETDEGSGERCLLIHNYGHGGSGVTMCWGSAALVHEILQRRLG